MAGYFQNIFSGLSTTLTGMKITLEHLFKKKVTLQYPEKWHPIHSGHMPANSRNRIALDMDECDGCNACSRACPVGCIDIEIVKVAKSATDVPLIKSTGKPRKTWVTKYDIDFALCCFCSLCTDACPTQAIVMTTEFEYSTYHREDLIYHFSQHSAEEVKEKKEELAKEKAEAAKAKAEAAAKAKAEEAAKAKEDTESKENSN